MGKLSNTENVKLEIMWRLQSQRLDQGGFIAKVWESWVH